MKTVTISGYGAVELYGVEYTPNKGPVELVSLFLADGSPLKLEVFEVEIVNPRPLRFNPVAVMLDREPDGAKLTIQQLSAAWEKTGCSIEFENGFGCRGKWPTFRDRQGAEIERYRPTVKDIVAKTVREEIAPIVNDAKRGWKVAKARATMSESYSNARAEEWQQYAPWMDDYFKRPGNASHSITDARRGCAANFNVDPSTVKRRTRGYKKPARK